MALSPRNFSSNRDCSNLCIAEKSRQMSGDSEMGEGIYWSIEGQLDLAKFEQFVGKVNHVLETTTVVLSGTDPFDMEPVCNNEIVYINGFAFNSSEPLIIRRVFPYADNFCKTRRHHYSKAVVAIVLLLKDTFPDQVAGLSCDVPREIVERGYNIAREFSDTVDISWLSSEISFQRLAQLSLS